TRKKCERLTAKELRRVGWGGGDRGIGRRPTPRGLIEFHLRGVPAVKHGRDARCDTCRPVSIKCRERSTAWTATKGSHRPVDRCEADVIRIAEEEPSGVGCRRCQVLH